VVTLSDVLFLGALIVVIFAVDLVWRWWGVFDWTRRWRDRDNEDDRGS
jgi:hypothetical protein